MERQRYLTVVLCAWERRGFVQDASAKIKMDEIGRKTAKLPLPAPLTVDYPTNSFRKLSRRCPAFNLTALQQQQLTPGAQHHRSQPQPSQVDPDTPTQPPTAHFVDERKKQRPVLPLSGELRMNAQNHE